MAGLDPATPPNFSLARLTSPLRGEVGAPGRAKRDPGKPGEGDFCSGPQTARETITAAQIATANCGACPGESRGRRDPKAQDGDELADRKETCSGSN